MLWNTNDAGPAAQRCRRWLVGCCQRSFVSQVCRRVAATSGAPHPAWARLTRRIFRHRRCDDQRQPKKPCSPTLLASHLGIGAGIGARPHGPPTTSWWRSSPTSVASQQDPAIAGLGPPALRAVRNLIRRWSAGASSRPICQLQRLGHYGPGAHAHPTPQRD